MIHSVTSVKGDHGLNQTGDTYGEVGSYPISPILRVSVVVAVTASELKEHTSCDLEKKMLLVGVEVAKNKRYMHK